MKKPSATDTGKELRAPGFWESDDYRRFRDRPACGDPDRPCQGCPKRFMGGMDSIT